MTCYWHKKSFRPHSLTPDFWFLVGDFLVVFRVQFCGGGRLLCVSTSAFQPREDMPKYHTEGCLGWYFCLRLKAEVLQVLCDCTLRFTARFLRTQGEVCFWRRACAPANRPSLRSGWACAHPAGARSGPSWIPGHTHARTHTHTASSHPSLRQAGRDGAQPRMGSSPRPVFEI